MSDDDEAQQRRLHDLQTSLAVRGVDLRADSQLCKAFVLGTLQEEYTAESVADSCALHKFLYEYTTYSEDCAVYLPLMAGKLAQPLGSWSSAWQFVKQHETPLIKSTAIAKCGGIPPVWPWLQQTGTMFKQEANENEKEEEEEEAAVSAFN